LAREREREREREERFGKGEGKGEGKANSSIYWLRAQPSPRERRRLDPPGLFIQLIKKTFALYLINPPQPRRPGTLYLINIFPGAAAGAPYL
jgi:hypothetical protein